MGLFVLPNKLETHETESYSATKNTYIKSFGEGISVSIIQND